MARRKRSAGRPDEPPASPLQRRGTSRTWYAPTTQDFIRLLRFREQAGPVYAIVGEHDRADIVARSIDEGKDRWLRLWTYPVIGLRAMAESGLLSMEQADEIPGFDESLLQASEAARRRYGPDPEYWRLILPPSSQPVQDPNQRPYRGPR